MGKFSIGATVVITEDSPLKGRTATITGVSKTSEHILYVQLRDGGAHIPVGDQEMRAASQQCKDCGGEGGSYFNGWYWDKCPTCDGTGTIHRTGPYRLADGSWSDGIDRSLRICDQFSTDCDQNRVFVWRYYNRHEMKHMWTVDRQSPFIDMEFSTWTEAIRYADHHARNTNNGDA